MLISRRTKAGVRAVRTRSRVKYEGIYRKAQPRWPPRLDICSPAGAYREAKPGPRLTRERCSRPRGGGAALRAPPPWQCRGAAPSREVLKPKMQVSNITPKNKQAKKPPQKSDSRRKSRQQGQRQDHRQTILKAPALAKSGFPGNDGNHLRQKKHLEEPISLPSSLIVLKPPSPGEKLSTL